LKDIYRILSKGQGHKKQERLRNCPCPNLKRLKEETMNQFFLKSIKPQLSTVKVTKREQFFTQYENRASKLKVT
jgi:hypothetical protein